jgi:hypothetical protein
MSEKKEFYRFKEGDEVIFGGIQGTVESVDEDDDSDNAIDVLFGFFDSDGDERRIKFTLDGRMFRWQTEPVLFLVSSTKELFPALYRKDGLHCVTDELFEDDTVARMFVIGVHGHEFVRLMSERGVRVTG